MRIVDKFAKTRRVFFKLKPCKFASKVPKIKENTKVVRICTWNAASYSREAIFYDIWLQINPFNLIKTQNQNFPVPS